MGTLVRMCILACTFCLVWPGFTSAQPVEVIRLWDKVFDGQERELRTVLDETVEDFGPYEIVPTVHMEEGRALVNLKHGDGIDLMAVPANIERSSTFLPINLPTSDTLLGYRVMYVRKGEEHLFEDVRTLEDIRIKGLTFGSGAHWADTAILQANGLNVITSAEDDRLVPMLQGGRFAAYPRGITQALRDLRPRHAAGQWVDVVVDEHILLVYPFRDIYYVSPDNPALAERIKLGFERAVADGTWEAMLKRGSALVQRHVRGLHLDRRRVILLDNPFLPEEVKNLPPRYDLRLLGITIEQ